MTENGGRELSSLSDLRVVELGAWVAAPAVGALLADWGADVVKVEAPTGDPMRRVFGSIGLGKDRPNPAFTLDNRGKRSVILDLREAADREHLERLLEGADVFVSNLRPDTLDKLGLEPEATVGRHPRLVYCAISGYGLRGEDRNRPSYDLGAFWARSVCRPSWPTVTGSRSTLVEPLAITSPHSPRSAGSLPRSSSSAKRVADRSSSRLCCEPAHTCWAGT